MTEAYLVELLEEELVEIRERSHCETGQTKSEQ